MTDEQIAMHKALHKRVDDLSIDIDRFRKEIDRVSERAELADRKLADEMAEALIKVNEKLDHTILQQTTMHRDQALQITRLQSSIDALSEDLKEPMEIYKTTKYGARAATWIVTTVRFMVPLGVAVLLGYNAWQTKMINEIKSEFPKAEQHHHEGSQ